MKRFIVTRDGESISITEDAAVCEKVDLRPGAMPLPGDVTWVDMGYDEPSYGQVKG
jgi:hypothetical protein